MRRLSGAVSLALAPQAGCTPVPHEGADTHYSWAVAEDGAELVSTARWGYLRLRRDGYDDAALGDWSRRIRAQGWAESFVFLKHEEQGPHLAARLLEISDRDGLRRVRLPVETERRGTGSA